MSSTTANVSGKSWKNPQALPKMCQILFPKFQEPPLGSGTGSRERCPIRICGNELMFGKFPTSWKGWMDPSRTFVFAPIPREQGSGGISIPGMFPKPVDVALEAMV